LEFLAEIIHYNEVEGGLGTRFVAAVEEASARALAFPRAGSPARFNTRRVFLKGFPFALIYQPEPDGIVVFAVAHHKRRPYYWQGRTRAR
jgi:toxin ParE1/3/4